MDRVTVEELLRRRIGLDPATAGPGLVRRALRARLNALGLDESHADQYLALVNQSGHEFQALVEEVVIPESWFFRDEHPFDLLAGRAGGWLTDPALPPFRALCVPCAGGEEPYSVCISLLDRGLPPGRFRVHAVDVSQSALDSAAGGVYSRNAFRSRDLAFRDRYFLPTRAGYELSEGVKAGVVFERGNLLDPGLLAGAPPFDVIFCRNLLIYFDEPARRRALETIDRLLGPGGLLFVGHAEQLRLFSEKFRPFGDRRCFAYERHPGTPAPTAPALPPASPRPVRGSTAATPRAVRPPAPRPRPQTSPGAGDPGGEVPAAGPEPLAEAARLAGEGRHAEAVALCESEMRRRGPSAAGFFLLGVIRQAVGDRAGAERSFEKVVYLDPGHEDALLALALLAGRRGDPDAAAAYHRRAERAFREAHPR